MTLEATLQHVRVGGKLPPGGGKEMFLNKANLASMTSSPEYVFVCSYALN